MSSNRQVIITSPTRANAPVKRASSGQTEDLTRSELDMEIEQKKAELAALQERASSAVEAVAEPSKIRSQQLKKISKLTFLEAKRSHGDGENSASEPPASQALNMAPAAFAVRDVRAHPGLQSSEIPASVPMKPFVHR